MGYTIVSGNISFDLNLLTNFCICQYLRVAFLNSFTEIKIINSLIEKNNIGNPVLYWEMFIESSYEYWDHTLLLLDL